MKKLILALILLISCKEQDLENIVNDSPLNNRAVSELIKIQYQNQMLSALKDEDGDYLIDGDIILTKNEVKEIGPLSLTNDIPDWDKTVEVYVYLWPTSTISFSVDEAFSNTQRAIIDQAINEWHNKTFLLFKEVPPGTLSDVYIKKAKDGCSSHMGAYPGGETVTIKLSETCDKQSVIHELGHVVGLNHEHQRENRDTYITMQPKTFEYIKSNYDSKRYNNVIYNLRKEKISIKNKDGDLKDTFTFDIQSAMMYGSYPRNDKQLEADLKEKKLPLYTDKSGKEIPRPEYGLTEKDIALVYLYYFMR